jgi:hypothetical protein
MLKHNEHKISWSCTKEETRGVLSIVELKNQKTLLEEEISQAKGEGRNISVRISMFACESSLERWKPAWPGDGNGPVCCNAGSHSEHWSGRETKHTGLGDN